MALAAIAPDWFPLDWSNLEDRADIHSPSDLAAVMDLWALTGIDCGFVMHGGRKRPQAAMGVAFLCKPSFQPHMVSFTVKDLPPEERDESAAKALELFRGWASTAGADYARICTGSEWERKNVIEQYVEPDGSIDPWMVFNQDITTGLPGVYWGTYFGKAYVDWFGGAERFKKAPWPHVERCGDGFLLVRSDSPFTWQEERALDARLREWLGDDAFFDIERRDRPLRTPNLEIPDPYSKPPKLTTTVVAKPKKRKSRERRPRGGKERLTDVPNSAELVKNVAFFRQLGFFAAWANKDDEDVAGALYDLHERQWGAGFSDERWLADLELLRWDAARVWWNDTEADVGPGNDIYVETLKEWMAISRSVFRPTRVKESWEGDAGPIDVSFQLGRAKHVVRPRFMDDYIDVEGLLRAVNPLIASSGVAFCMYEPFDQTAFVVALTAAEFAVHRDERHWRFWANNKWPGEEKDGAEKKETLPEKHTTRARGSKN